MIRNTLIHTKAFLVALAEADPESWVTPPGLGMMRAKHCIEGLKIGVLAVHGSGLSLAYVIPKSHGVCRECAATKTKSICTHCGCLLCKFERTVAEPHSPQVASERMKALIRRLKTFQLAQPAKVAALDAE